MSLFTQEHFWRAHWGTSMVLSVPQKRRHKQVPRSTTGSRPGVDKDRDQGKSVRKGLFRSDISQALEDGGGAHPLGGKARCDTAGKAGGSGPCVGLVAKERGCYPLNHGEPPRPTQKVSRLHFQVTNSGVSRLLLG